MPKFVKPWGKNCKLKVIHLSIGKCFHWAIDYFPYMIFYNDFKVDF